MSEGITKLSRYAKTRIRESLDDIVMQLAQISPGQGRRDALSFINKELNEMPHRLFEVLAGKADEPPTTPRGHKQKGRKK